MEEEEEEEREQQILVVKMTWVLSVYKCTSVQLLYTKIAYKRQPLDGVLVFEQFSTQCKAKCWFLTDATHFVQATGYSPADMHLQKYSLISRLIFIGMAFLYQLLWVLEAAYHLFVISWILLRIEIEKFVDLMYCRDSEEPNSWPFESLKAHGNKIGKTSVVVNSWQRNRTWVVWFDFSWLFRDVLVVSLYFMKKSKQESNFAKSYCLSAWRTTTRHSSTKPASSDFSRAGVWIPCPRICRLVKCKVVSVAPQSYREYAILLMDFIVFITPGCFLRITTIPSGLASGAWRIPVLQLDRRGSIHLSAFVGCSHQA